jgi:hypothetical protein
VAMIPRQNQNRDFIKRIEEDLRTPQIPFFECRHPEDDVRRYEENGVVREQCTLCSKHLN